MDIFIPIVIIVIVFIIISTCGWCCKRRQSRGVVYGVPASSGVTQTTVYGGSNPPYPVNESQMPQPLPQGNMPQPMAPGFNAAPYPPVQAPYPPVQSHLAAVPLGFPPTNVMETGGYPPSTYPPGAPFSTAAPYPPTSYPPASGANQLPPSYAEAMGHNQQPPTTEVYAKQAPYNPNF